LVYVALFIAFFVVFGRLEDPRTYLFLGSLFCLIVPALFYLRDDKWPEPT
jgi:hypothetical protein